MKLAFVTACIAWVYALVRLSGWLHHTGVYFALVMVVLTTANLVEEWRRHDRA